MKNFRILITGINYKKINIYIMVYHRKMDISVYGVNCTQLKDGYIY